MSDDEVCAVDLVSLVLRVRVRRVLRLAALLGIVALPVWLTVVLVGVGVNDDDSAAHLWFEDHALVGFVVGLAVFVFAVVAASVVGRSSEAGRAAAELVPLTGHRPDPVLTTKSALSQEVALLDAGSRSRRVDPPDRRAWLDVLLWAGLAVAVVITAVAGSQVGFEYRASRGDGGPIVTLGQDSRITRMDEKGPLQDADDGTRYYITSPLGEAFVDADRRPTDGTRFVVRSGTYGVSATEVGGDDWIDDLVGTVLGALTFVIALWFLVRRRRTRIVDDRLVPLDTTLADLLRDRPVTLYPWTPSRTGAVRTLTLAQLPGGSVSQRGDAVRTRAATLGAQIRARARWVTLVLVVIVVVVASTAGVVTTVLS